jgi:hypothetical protein
MARFGKNVIRSRSRNRLGYLDYLFDEEILDEIQDAYFGYWGYNEITLIGRYI